MLQQTEFLHKAWLWLLILIPLLVVWYWMKRKEWMPELKISASQGFLRGKSMWTKLYHSLFLLRMMALALFIIAMARPRSTSITTKPKSTKGIDIVMAIDVSASMLARDLKPNRLEALKKVASEFIMDRPNDRIGIVEYAGEAYTKTPITTDETIVLRSLRDIKYNTIIESGTAIGMGLATAVNRLKESKAKSKVIILLTDGVNNSGFIDPKIASELAVEYGIKTYTIGIGTNGTAMSPVRLRRDGTLQYGRVPVEIDEKLLKEIAQVTGGKYFRATNNKKLESIYKEINQLEKTEVEERKYYKHKENYRPLVWLGLIFIIIEFVLKNTLFKSFI